MNYAAFGIRVETLQVCRLNWHVPTLNRICEPFDGIRGRIHYLMSMGLPALFEQWAEELLEGLND
jgi:hypothetical protein